MSLRTVDNTVACCTVPAQTLSIPNPRTVHVDLVRIFTSLVRSSTQSDYP